MSNQLNDLNVHLFNQLERLNDDGLTGDQLKQEVARTKAIVGVSDNIVRNATVQLNAVKLLALHGDRMAPLMPEAINSSLPEPKNSKLIVGSTK